MPCLWATFKMQVLLPEVCMHLVLGFNTLQHGGARMQFSFDKSENEMQQLVNATTIYSSKQLNTTKISWGERTAACLQSGMENHGIGKTTDIAFWWITSA